MNSKLYVGNMSFKTNEAGLRDVFGQFGSVTDVHIANDRETGRPRGFAFVTFSTDTEAKLAVEKMNALPSKNRWWTAWGAVLAISTLVGIFFAAQMHFSSAAFAAFSAWSPGVSEGSSCTAMCVLPLSRNLLAKSLNSTRKSQSDNV